MKCTPYQQELNQINSKLNDMFIAQVNLKKHQDVQDVEIVKLGNLLQVIEEDLVKGNFKRALEHLQLYNGSDKNVQD